MIFGIGSGLLFFYFPWLKVNQAPAISYRTMPGHIFSKVARRLGFRVRRERFSSPQKAQQALDEKLQAGMPVGLQVGVYHLTYFPDAYRFHFNAHNLVVYGKEADTYLISDPVMEQPTRLSSQELEKVRFAQGTLAPKGHMYFPTHLPKQIDLKEAIGKGIKDTCSQMLAPVPIVGVRAIRWVSKDILRWYDKRGVKITNHYLAQMIRMQEEIDKDETLADTNKTSLDNYKDFGAGTMTTLFKGNSMVADWKAKLEKLFRKALGQRITMNPNMINKRIEDAPPGREDIETQMIKVAVLIDCSGSMGNKTVTII